jgi:hypothetical protein
MRFPREFSNRATIRTAYSQLAKVGEPNDSVNRKSVDFSAECEPSLPVRMARQLPVQY